MPQGAALAQTGPARTATASPAVKWGKWATAGLAVTFSALGIGAHNDADAAYRDLLRFCRASGPCLLGSDGRYAIRAAEDRYQRVVRGDRRARAWLIGGQAALIGSATLFVVELKRRRGPENIPFAPSLVAAGPGGVRVGWVIRWPVAAGR